jgi:hypothetical protein
LFADGHPVANYRLRTSTYFARGTALEYANISFNGAVDFDEPGIQVAGANWR